MNLEYARPGGRSPAERPERRGFAPLAFVILIAGCPSGDGSFGEPLPAQEPPPQNTPPNPSGLDARPSNTTCIAPARATGSATIGTQRVFPNLTFRTQSPIRNPLLMLQAPGDASRWFVVERFGVVQVFDNNPAVAATSVFSTSPRASSPRAPNAACSAWRFIPISPRPRVCIWCTPAWSAPRGGPDTHLSEFTSPDGGLTLDPDSERVILTITKSPSITTAAALPSAATVFSISARVTATPRRNDNAQHLTTLLGKILRIDIRGTTGSALYRIPADNPFAASTALCNVNGTGPQNCPEIYAWGFRNPWRWSFDRQTGDLWVGDVGETASRGSESRRARRQLRLALLRGYAGYRRWAAARLRGRDLLPPIAEYPHELGRAVTGGYVYRGTAIPGLVGRYMFGDFVYRTHLGHSE